MTINRLLCSLLCAATVTGATAQTATSNTETEVHTDDRMEWFVRGQLGLFIR